MDKRSKIAIWLDATERLLMCRLVSGVLPIYMVTEYPKSGGSWLSQMLAEAIGVPFPRNRRMGYRSCIAHGHYLFSPRYKNVVCMLRDGRDVMVSLYYHCLFTNERTSPIVVERTRRQLCFSDYDDVVSNLPRFMEYTFARQEASRSPFQFTWPQFVRSWHERDACFVKYEDLLTDAVGELRAAVARLSGKRPSIEQLEQIVEKYSFTRQADRSPGTEARNSFLRKGVAGDWRGKFSNEAREIFDDLAGEELMLLGYESDRSWIHAPSDLESLQT